MHAAPRIVSRAELAEHVYERDHEPDSNVIDVQISRLRRMLANLEAVESGQVEHIDTHLPGEMSELARAMNEVLERDRRLLERGRPATWRTL